ncbi:hypothetical protein ACI8AF_00315 [Blastococcus sp. SYSU D00669]
MAEISDPSPIRAEGHAAPLLRIRGLLQQATGMSQEQAVACLVDGERCRLPVELDYRCNHTD